VKTARERREIVEGMLDKALDYEQQHMNTEGHVSKDRVFVVGGLMETLRDFRFDEETRKEAEKLRELVRELRHEAMVLPVPGVTPHATPVLDDKLLQRILDAGVKIREIAEKLDEVDL
jgi:hypothetical protein